MSYLVYYAVINKNCWQDTEVAEGNIIYASEEIPIGWDNLRAAILKTHVDDALAYNKGLGDSASSKRGFKIEKIVPNAVLIHNILYMPWPVNDDSDSPSEEWSYLSELFKVICL